MKTRYTLALAAALLGGQAMAGTSANASTTAPTTVSSDKRFLTGSLTAGYNTNYVGRGIVISHSVAEGDSSEFAAMKLNYDFDGQKGGWSIDSTVAYTVVTSGHTLYGNPNARADLQALGQAAMSGYPLAVLQQLGKVPASVTEEQFQAAKQFAGGKVKQANIDNEFAVVTAAKYTTQYWNCSFGHDFIHGGLLGVMAKHYRDQGASCVNEVFLTPEVTPTRWLTLGCTTRFSFQGITGWWFEPYITAKAPIIGTPEDPKLVGVCTLGLSATADYFESRYFACSNGTQAFWIKLSTPYFASKHWVITPSVSFNWLGKGALKANEKSEFRAYSGNATNVPFRNFGVVAGISCTYIF